MKLIDLISRDFLAWTFFNFLAHCEITLAYQFFVGSYIFSFIVKHLFFKSTQVTKKEDVDKFKDILDEKANLKNQLAAMKRECNDLKSQSQEMDRLSIIESRVKKLKRRTLSLLEEEEEPVEENDAAQEVTAEGENGAQENENSQEDMDSNTGAKPKVLPATDDQNEEEIIAESSR